MAGMRTNPGPIAFTAALILTILLIVGAAVALVLLLALPGALEPLRSLTDNTWWFRYRAPSPANDLAGIWRIGGAALCAGLSLFAALRARALYRKSSSPLLPFLMLFLFSLSLECLRGGTALLSSADASIAMSIVLTRIMYWGRFVGLLGLLIAGLYCIEMKYRKITVLVGGVFLVAFAMAAYIPMDRTMFLAQLTWKLGDEQGVWFVNMIIAILVVGMSGIAAFSRHTPRFLWLTAGLVLLLCSRELLFFATGIVPLGIGLAVEAGGVFLCLRTLSVIYRQAGDIVAL
jgi:hypothetical protein